MGKKPSENVDPVRHRIMAAVKRRDTKPELLVRSTLHKLGYRFRTDFGPLPGHPDIAFTRRKMAVFVHGCFWHAHQGCHLATKPKTNVQFWTDKLARNVERDAQKAAALEHLGWRV